MTDSLPLWQRSFVTGEKADVTMTVVLPVLNNEHDLPDCLASLKKQTFTDFCVMIVDGYSKDRTVELAAEQGCMVLMDEGRSRGHAANTGLPFVQTPYMCYTDADCEVDPDWIEKLMEGLELDQEKVKELTGRDRPTASVGGPNLGPVDDPWTARAVDVCYLSPMMTGTARYGVVLNEMALISHNPGCNAAYRTSDAQESGFDDLLPTAEDLTHDLRIERARKPILFHPGAIVRHHRRPTLKAFYRQVYRYGLGRKHANALYPHLHHLTHRAPSILVLLLFLFTLGSLPYLISLIPGLDLPEMLVEVSRITLTIYGILAGIYIMLAWTGALLSPSPSKSLSTIFFAPVFGFIAHIAWGRGYLKGHAEVRRGGIEPGMPDHIGWSTENSPSEEALERLGTGEITRYPDFNL